MKLWTLQPLSIMKEIDNYGSYRCNKELSFNLSKENSLVEKYQWLNIQMEQRIGKAPEGVEYPVWAWHTWKGERRCPDVDSAAFLRRTEDKVLLTLEVPEEDVVLTDFDAWQIVLNDGYLTNETDPQKYDELESYLESLDDMTMIQEIRNSWTHVFETERKDLFSEQRGYFIQATLWELKKEYIIDTCTLYRNKEN